MENMAGLNLKVKEVDLDGGPPWGFRLGAFTTTTLTTVDNEGGVQIQAIKIARVNPGSKASSAGLRDGDLILSVNGENVNTSATAEGQPNLKDRPSTTSSGGTNDPSPNASTSNSNSPSQSDQHHRIVHQLQENKIRLGVLSKKSKSKKKASAAGNASNSVRWADEDETNSYRNHEELLIQEEALEPDKDKSDKSLNKDKSDDTPMLSDVDEAKDTRQMSQEEGISRSSRAPPTLLDDIMDELQLAAVATANFLTEMELQLQEESSSTKNSETMLQRQLSNPSAFQAMPTSLLIKQEDLSHVNNVNNVNIGLGRDEAEEIPPVWTPPSVQPSPKMSKKTFRPVNFNVPGATATSTPTTPTVKNQNQSTFMPSNQSATLPLSILSPPTDSYGYRQLLTSSSTFNQNATTNLPKYQSPTVTLLQKAREGHLPKGAAYLQTQNSDRNGISNNIPLNQNQPVIISFSQQNSYPPSPKARPKQRPNEIIDIPLTSKSCLSGEKEQREWYKKMYESLHVEKNNALANQAKKCSYPAARIKTGPPAKSFWARKIHSNGTQSEPEDDMYFDHPEAEEYDFNKFGKVLSPTGPNLSGGSRTIPPGAIRFNNPGRIEDYNPGGSSTSAARRQRNYRQMQPDLKKHWALSSPKSSSGYESDSNYIMRKRTTDTGLSGFKSPNLEEPPPPPPLSPAEQRHLYVEIQKGGEVPLQGLRKFMGTAEDNIDGFRTHSPSQNIRYSESTVNIHYRAPVRIEEKQFVAEEELRRRQEQQMKKFYEEQRKLKYMREIEDMERRRHSDNFVPSQKSPIPLNRYEDGDDFDGLVDNTPRPNGGGSLWQRMTPEPQGVLVARALFNFTAQSLRELQLVKGDLVLIKRKIDSNWYEGELKNSSGRGGGGSSALGIFPCSYVQILPDDLSQKSPRNVTNFASVSEGTARVLYNFRPSSSFELELVKGEIVIISRRVDQNWFEGRRQRRPTFTGIFPVSYVDIIKEIGPTNSNSNNKSPNPLLKKPVGQPVAHSLNYSELDSSARKHHYKPNEFVLHDDSDYGEVFSPDPRSPNRNCRGDGDRNSRNKMNQRLELITIDTRLNNGQPFRYRAIYNYKPMHTDELELAEDDIIEVMEKCDDGWFVGTSQRTGMFGTFPGNYVERV